MTDNSLLLPLLINSLSVAHDKKIIFENLSLHVEPGEIFGLIGVNGAGKTSLMKAALRLVDSEDADVRFFGVSSKKSESRRQVAYLPENFRPPSAMKGTQFLRSILGFHTISFDRARADHFARAIDLDPAALDRRIATLSKGMAQKLGLLATFLTNCPLLILDEPMSGLDPRARIMLKTQMQAYRAMGKAIFLSSHILTDLEELCDRIAVLHNGVLCFTGRPDALLQIQNSASLERAFLALIAEPQQ